MLIAATSMVPEPMMEPYNDRSGGRGGRNSVYMGTVSNSRGDLSCKRAIVARGNLVYSVLSGKILKGGKWAVMDESGTLANTVFTLTEWTTF